MRAVIVQRWIRWFLLVGGIFSGAPVAVHGLGMHGPEDEPPPMHEELPPDDVGGMGEPGTLGRAFARRLDAALHSGIITAEEAARLRAQKEDLDAYHVEVWKDDIMTRTERDALARKSAALRRTVQEVFRRAMERGRGGAGGRDAFRKRIQHAVSRGGITREQADRLIALHDDLVRAREAAWADNQMTRTERDELAQKARAFRGAVREAFKREPRPEPRGPGKPRRHGE